MEREILRDASALLRFQGELGLTGLDVGDDVLTRRTGATQLKTAPSVSEPAVTKRVADPAAALAAIRDDIGDCTRCNLSSGRTSIVFGVGDPAARLMFIGEAPGRDEDLQGEPFVGKAGKLLDRMITAMGLRRRDVYIANIVKCRPPKNRDPETEEVAACEPFLMRQISVIEPEVIVAMGRYATQTLLRNYTSISRLRGTWREYAGIPLMPTFHPAYLLRNPAEKSAVWQDLQQVMGRLGLEDPRNKS